MRTSLWRRAGELSLLGFCFALPLRAATLVLADFDNTIVETRQERGGSFQTPFRLFRVEQKVTVLEPELEGPSELDVSPWDFERLKPFLAKDESRLGAVSKKFVLQDGRTIRVGHYRIRSPETFKYFFPGKDGQNYLLENFVEAENRQPAGNFRGPFWEPMSLLLSEEHAARNFGIITARAHTESEWTDYFSHLQQKQYVRYAPNPKLIFGVGGRDFERFSLKGVVAKQKAAVLETIANEMNRLPLTAEDEKLSADGKHRERLHTIVFADDNQETLELVIRKFQHMAQSRLYKVKFCVFNMGKATEIRNSRRPQYSILLPDGTFRQATRFEMLGEPQVRSAEMDAFLSAEKSAASCQAAVEE